jgi:epimerase transport system membrane fusion protein
MASRPERIGKKLRVQCSVARETNQYSEAMALLEIPADATGEATRIVRGGVLLILAFFGALLIWGAWAPISGAIVAEGAVKIDTKRKTVQHREGGIVKEILVHEGDFVEQGQPLLILEDSEVRSALNIFTDQLNAQLVKEARLLAEKKFANTVEFPPELAQSPDPKIREMLRNEQALFLAKKKGMDEEIAVIRTQIGQARQEELSILAEIEAASENIRYKEERVKSGELLSAKQFIQKNEFLQLKEGLAEKREALAELKAALAVSRQRQAELELRIVNLRNEHAKAAGDELKEAKKAIFELQEKIRPAELTAQRFRVVAPTSGQVIDLKVTTVGGVVGAGESLMDLVPKQQDLMVEAKVLTQYKASVYVGQRADVQLLAFKGMPHVDGSVVYVSGDALEEKNRPDIPAYYLTHIRLSGDSLQRLRDVTLVPGMPVTAYMQTRSRTFLELLVKPLADAADRGLRQDY